MDEADILDALLFWMFHATEEWQKIPGPSFPRNASGNLLNERVRMSRDGWIKPDVREWGQIIVDGQAVFANPSDRLRRQMTQILRQMECDGLVELVVAPNQRVLWASLTAEGWALAEPLCDTH